MSCTIDEKRLIGYRVYSRRSLGDYQEITRIKEFEDIKVEEEVFILHRLKPPATARAAAVVLNISLVPR